MKLNIETGYKGELHHGWPYIDGQKMSDKQIDLATNIAIKALVRSENKIDWHRIYNSFNDEFNFSAKGSDILDWDNLDTSTREAIVERVFREVGNLSLSLDEKNINQLSLHGGVKEKSKVVVFKKNDVVLEVPANFSDLAKKEVVDAFGYIDDHNSGIPFSDKIIDIDEHNIANSKINTPVWLNSFLMVDGKMSVDYYKENFDGLDFLVDVEDFDSYMKRNLKTNPFQVEKDTKYDMVNSVNSPNDLSRNILYRVYKKHGKDIYRAIMSTHNGNDDRAGYPEPLITKEFGPDTLKMLLGQQISVSIQNDAMADRGEMTLSKFADKCEILHIESDGSGECLYENEKYRFALFCEATKLDINLQNDDGPSVG